MATPVDDRFEIPAGEPVAPSTDEHPGTPGGEPVAGRVPAPTAGLCTMADLDVLAGELDEIDAALARMDAARSDAARAGPVSRDPSPSP